MCNIQYVQVRRRVAHACKLVEAASMDNLLVAQHMNAAEIQVLCVRMLTHAGVR